MTKLRLHGNQLILPEELRRVLTAEQDDAIDAEEVDEGVLLKRSPAARRAAGLADIGAAQAGVRYLGAEFARLRRSRRAANRRHARSRQSRRTRPQELMRQAVFDSTVLVSAFLRPDGLSNELLALAAQGDFGLVLAPEIIARPGANCSPATGYGDAMPIATNGSTDSAAVCSESASWCAISRRSPPSRAIRTTIWSSPAPSPARPDASSLATRICFRSARTKGSPSRHPKHFDNSSARRIDCGAFSAVLPFRATMSRLCDRAGEGAERRSVRRAEPKSRKANLQSSRAAATASGFRPMTRR